jgi:Tol biopolymer transport system component
MTRTWLLAGALFLAGAGPSAAAEPVNGRLSYTTFESSADPAAGDLWTMEPDGSDRTPVVLDPGYDAQSDWSPDGTKLVFRSRRSNRFQVSVVDLTVRPPRISDVATAPDATQSSQPSWFPNGQGFLYRRTNGPETTRSDVWAMNLDGTGRHPVVVAPEDQFYPAYNPDMTKILFATTAPGGGRSVQVYDVATAKITTLFDATPQSYDSGPAWSPDGKEIAFESNADGDMEIYVMNADGTNVRQITHNTVWDEGPAWSPDGKRFAFSHGADDLHLDIWTMDRDGSNPRQLTAYPGRDESPDWGINPHPAGVGGTVPATLSLSVANPPGFGTFLPGVARVYETSTAATVTSTAGNATLSADGPHYLANGALTLPQPLQIAFSRSSWSGPTSNEPVTVAFKQPIGATDALRTGAYATTVTLTLSTTEP